MKIKNLCATAALSLAVSSAHATTFSNNSNDVRFTEAHYGVSIMDHVLAINIPGASIANMGPGSTSVGEVTGFVANGTGLNSSYNVTLSVATGSMHETIDVSDTTSFSGIGLYHNGTNTQDIGAALTSMLFMDSTNNSIPVALAANSAPGCVVANNRVVFEGPNSDGASCTLEFTGAALAQVDTNQGAPVGKVLYNIATSRDAGQSNTYENHMNYTIALAAL